MTVELPSFALAADDSVMGTVRAKYVFVFVAFRFVSTELNAGVKNSPTSIFGVNIFTFSFFLGGGESLGYFQLKCMYRDLKRSGLKGLLYF